MDVRVAMTGFGNVGQGVASLLADHGDEYARRYGVRLTLTAVADRQGAAIDRNGLDPRLLLMAKQTEGTVAGAAHGRPGLRGAVVLDESGAQVLVEAASTNFVDAEPGWGYIKDAVAQEMDLVLASKGALVLHYDQLMSMARHAGLHVLFSGTTGAPLPVLELADRALIGTKITGFDGIVNATTNQILTSMAEGMSYDQGVHAAQEAGIAETDPTLDVDGWDAAAKVVIIARAVLGANIGLEDVKREGIRGISTAQLHAAQLQGETLKLIARARRFGSGVEPAVSVERRPLADPLGRLRGQEMGIVFYTEPLGVVTATVQQTGGIPTALTVLRDVINLSRARGWAKE